ncbi:LexA family protein [Candidatus Latescibacterota bacterium]
MHVRVMRTHGQSTNISCPMVSGTVAAGFPSPADDYIDGKLDLNSHLIKHPAATYFVRAAGESMIGAGIHHDDILIVDRSIEPGNGSVVIAALEGDLTVKRLSVSRGKTMLMPDNGNYRPITIGEGTNCEVWGVVTAVIHKL